MRKLLGYILSPITIVLFFLVLCVFQPIQWLCYKLGGYAVHKRCVDILNFCLTSTIYFLGDTVTFVNQQNLPEGKPIVFLANHQSLLDIPPLIWHLRRYHAKFISKIELTKNIPSISYNLKVGGGANIDRKDQRQSITELMKLGQRMKDNNWSAVIFPEGTRSADGKVRKFHSAGVATILKKCPNALLVPIAINNSWQLVRYGVYPLNTFTHVTLKVLEPIEANGAPIDELVALAEARIKEELRQA